MLTKTEQKFTWIYVLIVIAELLCGYFESLSLLHNFTKPLIVLSLIIFFVLRSQGLHKSTKILTLLALIFSVVGDIALLFDALNPIYFMLGLGAFLLAHTMYILVFLRHRDRHKKSFGFTIVMLVYASFLFYFLKDGLGDLLIPVLVYMSIILMMSISAFLRKHQNNLASYKWVFTGAIYFMVSDSILAIDKFYESFAFSSIAIMLTYACAQYCIIIGVLKEKSLLR